MPYNSETNDKNHLRNSNPAVDDLNTYLQDLEISDSSASVGKHPPNMNARSSEEDNSVQLTHSLIASNSFITDSYFIAQSSMAHNVTTIPVAPFHSDSHIFGKILAAFIMSLIVAGTIGGNTLVVISVGKFRRLKKQVCFHFMASLAIADILVAALVMTVSIFYTMSGRWNFGWIFCR